MDNNVPRKRVEIADDKFKRPSLCSTGGVFNCVEVAVTPDTVGVRDTKDPAKTTLMFDRAEWATFVQAVKRGEFDT